MLSTVTAVYSVFMPARTNALIFVKQFLSIESAKAREIGSQNNIVVSFILITYLRMDQMDHSPKRQDFENNIFSAENKLLTQNSVYLPG